MDIYKLKNFSIMKNAFNCIYKMKQNEKPHVVLVISTFDEVLFQLRQVCNDKFQIEQTNFEFKAIQLQVFLLQKKKKIKYKILIKPRKCTSGTPVIWVIIYCNTIFLCISF